MAKGKKPMPIRTLGDMVDLVNHNSEFFEHSIRKLAKSSRHLRFLSVLTIGCVIYVAVESRKQDEELYKLSLRVKKLENDKGE